jgi:lysyl-tRNA synthetase class 2
MNPDTIRARSMLTSAVRAFFSLKNYLEVETPILAPALIPEAAIEVFRTRFEHPWRGSQDMYLTPSPELWMKRLLAEGSGNIFQICKAFRNAESIGEQHNPEFTILEYYTVNADYMDSLKLTEDFFEYLCDYPRGGALAFPAGRGKGRGLEENCKRLRPPFRRMSMEEAFQTYARIDLASFAPRRAEQEPAAAKALTEEARGKGLPSKEGDSWEEAFNRIFAGAVEPLLPEDRPLVLLNYPRGVHCLARDIPESPWNERWELYAGGRETANCFTEESDPRRIAAYFQAEAAAKRGALVPHAIDEEFIGLYENACPASGRASGLAAKSRTRFCGQSMQPEDCRCAAQGIPGAQVAPTTIHTYRKAAVFGRIVAESPQARRRAEDLERKARFRPRAGMRPYLHPYLHRESRLVWTGFL